MSGGVNMQNEKLFMLCQSLGVKMHDRFLSDAAIEAIERQAERIADLEAENALLEEGSNPS